MAMIGHTTLNEAPSFAPSVHILPRSGQRPLSVNGDILIAGSQATQNRKIQYDIAVFEDSDAGFAASLTCSYDQHVEMPRRYAKTFDQVDDAIQFFGSYCPADDVHVTSAMLDQTQPANADSLIDDIANADAAYTQLLAKLFPGFAGQMDGEEGKTCLA
jgi:hypothetical protein